MWRLGISLFGLMAILGLILFVSFNFEREESRHLESQLKRYEAKKIIFLGDSITAGFGWHTNNVAEADNYFRLKHCAETEGLTDNRCSNNSPSLFEKNVDRTHASVKPNVAFPYQLGEIINGARQKMKMTELEIENYAVSGSTPSQWNPLKRAAQLEEARCEEISTEKKCNYKSSINCQWQEGRCQLTEIGKSVSGFFAKKGAELKGELYSLKNRWGLDAVKKNSDVLFVMTLGGDPILKQWMNPAFFLFGALTPEHGSAAWDVRHNNGYCMKSVENAKGCIENDIEFYRVQEHLTDLYGYLLDRGDVLAMKYPSTCPGFFAQTDDNWTAPLWPGNSPVCNELQSQIVRQLGAKLNEAIEQAVNTASLKRGKYRISTVCSGYGYRSKENPSGDCDVSLKHGHGSKDPWVITFDSGIHPNKKGHKVLAQSALYGLCEKLGHFCTELTAWGGRDALP